MEQTEWIVAAGFLAFGGFTFLRLIAGARHAAVDEAEAVLAELQKRREEEAREIQEAVVPEVKGL